MTLVREVLFAGDGLEVRRVVCRPDGAEPGEVEHGSGPTFVFPAAGVFRLHLGRNDAFVADPNQAVFLPPGEAHRYSHPAPGGDDCLAVELAPAQLADLIEELRPAAGEPGRRSSRTWRVVLTPRALRARAELDHRLRARAASALEAEETALGLLAFALAAAGGAGRPAGGARAARARAERVEAVQLLLARDPGNDWRLAGLARSTATSACHLTTVFRRETGIPIHRYLTRLRLAHALEQVLGGERELTAIGLDLGFSTPSHFTATFRRELGITPSELRRIDRRGAASERRKNLTARARARL
jgi:AraC-like DNA-binding protein